MPKPYSNAGHGAENLRRSKLSVQSTCEGRTSKGVRVTQVIAGGELIVYSEVGFETMEVITNLLEEIKSINFRSVVGWGIVIWLVIFFFGLSLSYPTNFFITTTIFFLLYLIHGYGKQIDTLNEELKQKNEVIKSIITEYERKITDIQTTGSTTHKKRA